MIQMKQAKYGGIIKKNPPSTADVFAPIDYEKFNFTPILTLFNQAVLPGVNVIPVALTAPLPCDCLIRVIVSENTGVVFSLSLTRVGVAVVMPFNAGAALVANSLYMFDFNARVGDTINFQFGGLVPLTVNVLNVDMIRTAGP